MADIRITALSSATGLSDDDVLHGVQNADNRDKKFDLSTLKTFVNAAVTTAWKRFGTVLSPVNDGDSLVLNDSTATASVNLDAGTSSIPLVRDSSGKIGVGVASPGYAIDIQSADTTASLGYVMRLRHNSTANAAAIQFTDSGATAERGWIASDSSSNLRFATGSGEKMRLDTNGRLGLGATSPSTLLHIQSTDPAFRFKRSDAGTDAYGELTTDTSGLVTMKCDPANAAAGSGLRVTVDNTERLRIGSTGSVTISGLAGTGGTVVADANGELSIGSGGSVPDGTAVGQRLRWSGSSWVPTDLFY